jgi:transcriptional regulator of heat shock response
MNCSYGKILLILALEDKVEEYVIKTNSEISDEELFEIKTYLLKSLKEEDKNYLDKYRKTYPNLINQIEKILNERLRKREIGDIYFKGIKYILSYEDIKKSKDLETLITFIEEKERALSLIDFLAEFKNLLILIGNEIENLTLEKTVLIDLPYLKEDIVEAGLGFITPNRFDFEYLFKILKQHAFEIKEKLEKI